MSKVLFQVPKGVFMNNDKFTRESDKRFTLRIDKNLFELIKIQAEINRRPIGNEIEYALGRYYASLIKDMQKNNLYLSIADYLSKYDPSLVDFEDKQ